MAEERSGAVAFFDVDGTLVWRDFEKMRASETAGVNSSADIRPTDAVYEAFDRMRERGNLTFVCTGRPLCFIVDSLLELRPDGLVAAAGAYVSVGQTVVRDESIPPDLLMETARRLEEAGVDVTFESNERDVEMHPSGRPCFLPGVQLVRSAEEVCAFAEAGRRFVKFCIAGASLDDLGPAREFCERHYTISDLQGGVFEYAPRGVDKGTAIEMALAHLGHGRENTFAFGDSENDLFMAGAVETFVAMGNALPSVRERADYVTDSAANDGVVSGLEHFGLI